MRALGTKIEKAFNDPIQAIKAEFGLVEETFFKLAEENILAGPFP